MEGTLIRNLSDHSGNNLLHVMAVFGHLAPLAWLLTTQQVLVDALHDENKFGLTPLVCAIKVRKLHTVMVVLMYTWSAFLLATKLILLVVNSFGVNFSTY